LAAVTHQRVSHGARGDSTGGDEKVVAPEGLGLAAMTHRRGDEEFGREGKGIQGCVEIVCCLHGTQSVVFSCCSSGVSTVTAAMTGEPNPDLGQSTVLTCHIEGSGR
jgi:hypothetical protein